jgi:hypothetical protein
MKEKALIKVMILLSKFGYTFGSMKQFNHIQEHQQTNQSLPSPHAR